MNVLLKKGRILGNVLGLHWVSEMQVYNADMSTRIEKIVSVGQTGADRAALDWAIKKGVRMVVGVLKGVKLRMGRLIYVIYQLSHLGLDE